MRMGKAETTFRPRVAGESGPTFFPRAAGEVLSAAKRRGYFVALALIGSALFLSSSATAGWRDEATPADVQRLEQLSQSRLKGLDEASAGNSSDLNAIRSILQAGTVPAAAGKLTGVWKCRTMKLGGLTPEIVYGWFKCRISQSHDGRIFFEKLSGSQRTSGYLYPEGDGFVYLGASYVNYNGVREKPPVYSGRGASVGAAATPDDQIGMLSLAYDGRARLELPSPVQESVFDVIELKR
jgi:hypothetical protein